MLFVNVTADSWDLIGERGTREAIESILREFTLGEVFEFLGRLSAVLGNAREDRAGMQIALLQWFFHGDELRTVRAGLERFVREHKDAAGWVAFFEEQLLTLAKLAALTLEPDLEKQQERDLRPLGRALLLTTSYVERVDPIDPTDPSSRLQHTFALGYARPSSVSKQRMVLGHDLLLAGPYVEDLQVRGISEAEFFATGVALHSSVAIITDETIARRRAALDVRQHFSGSLGLTPDRSEALIRHFCAPAEQFVEECRDLYSWQRPRRFDVLPFRRSPFVEFNGTAVCTSMALLADRVTSGLRHFHMDHDLIDSARRQSYLDEVGRRTGALVESALAEMYPAGSGRLVTDRELLALQGSQVSRADGAVLFEEGAVVYEIKSAGIPHAATTGEGADALTTWLDRNLVGAVQQISSTVDWMVGHGEEALGLRSQSAVFVPVVFLLADVPMSPWLYDWWADRLKRQGFWSRFRGPRPQVVSLVDLDVLPSAARELRMSIPKLLATRAVDPDGPRVPFMNWLEGRYPGLPARLTVRRGTDERFALITDRALETLRGMGQTGTPT